MISAPNFQNALKWILFGCMAFTCVTVISVINPLVFPIKYQQLEAAEKLRPFFQPDLNSTLVNYSDRFPDIDSAHSDAVNPHSFSFLMLDTKVCSNFNKSNRINMITVVHSAPRHFKARAFIRNTWGDRSLFPENRVLFILGLDNNSSSTQRLLLEESRQYGDLIQENFVDTYHNLTYKAVAWLRFVSRFCPNVDFVLKVDDDVVVNMRHVTKFLRIHYGINDRRTIYCLIWYNLTVQREPDNKWHLSKEDYDNDYFPSYCSGSAYILTTDVIKSLYEQSYAVPFFWIDDIYVTGILVKRFNDLQTNSKLKIRHYDLSARYILSRKLLADQFLQNFAMFAHVPGSMNARHWLWDEMHKSRRIPTPRFAYIADAAIRL